MEQLFSRYRVSGSSSASLLPAEYRSGEQPPTTALLKCRVPQISVLGTPWHRGKARTPSWASCITEYLCCDSCFQSGLAHSRLVHSAPGAHAAPVHVAWSCRRRGCFAALPSWPLMLSSELVRAVVFSGSAGHTGPLGCLSPGLMVGCTCWGGGTFPFFPMFASSWPDHRAGESCSE